ncbi:MAG TPA: metallophosphoesterase, partial [Acidobacteriaceae bacterium]|nr:metallophosphoesterase [Acidobacteriaceae bacterium]
MPLAKAVVQLLAATMFAICISVSGQTAMPVVMLSDIHFDPFHDPAKVAQLRQQPIERWPAILNAAASPTQAADLQALQTNCHAHALDTAWPLLKSTLQAAHDAEPHPLFVTLAGDLLTHEFPCRFVHLNPGTTPEDVSAFSAKTVAFVMAQLHETFPHSPVYGSLGNNDSGCNDYHETPGDSFLTAAAASLRTAADAKPISMTPEGDYSVTMPAPMEHTRLVVLEDVFESRQFTTCSGESDRNPEKAQIDWLRTQLTEARAANEHVWVMSHIPPGIDVYTSFRHYLFQPAEMCKADPRSFLADTTLPDALLDYADVVRLALFGHTHMDELRLLHRSAPPAPAGAAPATETAIPAKLVPSVSPYVGNHPAFLVASV